MRVHVHLHRTADASPPATSAAPGVPVHVSPLARLYEDLLRRAMGALAEVRGTADAAWREDLHPRRNDGKFGHGEVHADVEPPQKPTTTTAKGGMDKMRELFASGHSFTRAELLAATGLVERKLTDYLAMLKNPKWAGAKGALTIERNSKGEYFVALSDGKPAPPPEAPPPVKVNVLEGFDAERHEKLNQEAGALAIAAHRLSENVASHHSGERAKVHIRSALSHLDEARRSNTAALTISEGARTMYQDKAAQALGAARSEIEYGQGQLARAAEQKAKEVPAAPASPAAQHATAQVLAGSAPAYEPQKDSKAAAEWAVKNGYVDKADFGKVDPEFANDYLTALGDHLQEFPALRTRQDFAGSTQAFYKNWVEAQVERNMDTQRRFNPGLTDAEHRERLLKRIKKPKAPGRAWALAHNGSKGLNAITLNEKYLGKGAAAAKIKPSMVSAVTQRWHPLGCDTIKSIADHELGHQLDHLLDLRKNPEMLAIRFEAYGGTPGANQYGGIPISPSAGETMTANVSAYAKTNAAEFIAEAWAEYRNNPEPRQIARRVGELIRSEYAKKYPKHG